MVNPFIAKFKRKHKKDISENNLNTPYLPELRLVLRLIYSIKELSLISLSPTLFEELNADMFFQGTLGPVEKVLRDAKLDKSQIYDMAILTIFPRFRICCRTSSTG